MSVNDEATLAIVLEIYDPNYSLQEVSLSRVPEMYEGLGAAAASFTWNDGGDEVLIVSVGEDYSTAVILRDRSFYDLRIGDEPGVTAIELAGGVVDHPNMFILPRDAGLKLLMKVPDFESIVQGGDWQIQD